MAIDSHKIIAIGGGEIGRPKADGSGYYPVETGAIDSEILRLTGKKTASLLFIPTASSDSRDYYDVVKKHFMTIGFTSVDVLFLLDRTLTKEQIEEMILSHDAIYVGGGNTLKMMTTWRRFGVDTMLKRALDQGVVLSGISAGAICWFSRGVSDSRRFSSGNDQLIKVTGLGFIDAVLCPHYDVEMHRQPDVKKSMLRSSKVAICLDNCTAIEIIGNEYRIITSKASAKAYRTYWKNNTYYAEEIKASESFHDLEGLLVK